MREAEHERRGDGSEARVAGEHEHEDDPSPHRVLHGREIRTTTSSEAIANMRLE
ncbi:MAG TPA: hypothetical protein VGK69_03535 [Gaiellaceae bacterium]